MLVRLSSACLQCLTATPLLHDEWSLGAHLQHRKTTEVKDLMEAFHYTWPDVKVCCAWQAWKAWDPHEW